jgi:ATP-binding cassette subfamily B protein
VATVANKFAQKMRTQISKKINKLPLRYFDTHSYGDLLSRVTNDVDTIAMSLSQSLGTLVGAITLFIGSIIMMFYTNWILAITGIVSSLLGFVAMFVIMAKSQKYFNARQVELGLNVDTVRNFFGGHNFKEGKSVGIHLEPGPDGGLVMIDDTTVLERALKILDEMAGKTEEAVRA